MGIKKLPWKKIWGYLWKIIFGIIALISLVGTIIGITKDWNVVLNLLSSIGNFFLKILNPLANPIVRDVLLFLLIVGTLIWVFIINKKLKKLSQTYEEKIKAYLEEKPKKEEKPKRKEEPELTVTQVYILANIANAPDSLGEHALFDLYQSKHPDSLRFELKSTISDLLGANLIRRAGAIGSESFYGATDKGVKLTNKLLKKGKK